MTAWRWVTVIAALNVVTSACSGGSVPSPAAEPPPRPGVSSSVSTQPVEPPMSEEPDRVGATTFPLDEVLTLAWDDRRALILAEHTLVARCMQSQGWPYEIPEVPVRDPGRPLERRYGAGEEDLRVIVGRTGSEGGSGGSVPSESPGVDASPEASTLVRWTHGNVHWMAANTSRSSTGRWPFQRVDASARPSPSSSATGCATGRPSTESRDGSKRHLELLGRTTRSSQPWRRGGHVWGVRVGEDTKTPWNWHRCSW